MASSSDIFNQVRNAVDIVDVIAEHLALKKAGREYTCLCPFHPDHRPSMRVVPHKQIFHCFVCATGGDVFQFVQLYHKMTKGESLRFLAQRAGITLPELPRNGRSGPGGDGPSEREQIITANDRAATYFQKNLRSPGGQLGLDYLLSRGLTNDTIDQFRLGYSLDNWTALTTNAPKINLTGPQLIMAGLVKTRQDGSYYDAFRARVIFPICDSAGRTIAFGGRILVEKKDPEGNVVEAKYLNSPETRAFNKSETLYGLHLAKSAIIKSSIAIIVEGYMDVIACHQAGVTNVVATLGTALTPEHARILRRFCNTVVLVFDSDDAGRRAADRAMQTFVHEPIDVKITAVPDGKDPCDFCMTHGGPALTELTNHAPDALTFQWRALQKEFQATDSISAQQKATEEFLKFAAATLQSHALDPIRRGLLVTHLSNLIGLPSEDINKRLKSLATPTPAPNQAYSPSAAPHQPSEPAAPAANPNIRLTGASAAEAWVLGSLLTTPTLYANIREDITLSAFTVFPRLAERLLEYLDNSSDLTTCSLAEFIANLDDQSFVHQAIRLQAEAENGGKVDQKLFDAWKWMQDQAQEQIQHQRHGVNPLITPDQAAASQQDELSQSLEIRRQQRLRGEVKKTLGPPTKT